MKELRKHPYCIIAIPRESLHKEIHEWLTDIPAPSPGNAAEVLFKLLTMENRQAISEDDGIEMRLQILAALFDSCEPTTAEALREQLKIVRAAQSKPS